MNHLNECKMFLGFKTFGIGNENFPVLIIFNFGFLAN